MTDIHSGFVPGTPNLRGFQGLVGFRIEKVEGGAEVWLDLGPQHLNSGGFGHGGLVLTLLDTVGGFSVYYHVQPKRVVTLNLSAQFLAPAELGTIVATCNIERIGGTVVHTSLALHAHDPDGPLVATAIAAYRIFRET